MTSASRVHHIAVLTSGGDAPGMNAAVRGVVRAALAAGRQVSLVRNGYEGLIHGWVERATWNAVGGILHRGGTFIGTARSQDFYTVEGRAQAARTLLSHRVDALVVIGGEGSLTGALTLAREWPQHVRRWVDAGEIAQDRARPYLLIAGIPGTIDNDIACTDMTLGADSALHRIVEAVDALASTAASHQRTFVVEVMGRRCGYLALMGALATGADWVLIPEYPVHPDRWQEEMGAALRAGRAAGRSDSIVIVAEGARDVAGRPITSDQVKRALENFLNEEARLTVLGHVQRGGTPSAFDRNLGTRLGYAAVQWLLSQTGPVVPHHVGIRGNEIALVPLDRCLEQTRAVEQAVAQARYEEAIRLRGAGFEEAFRTFHMLIQPRPRRRRPRKNRYRLAILHVGDPAPGMNAAVRAAVRLALDQGHEVRGYFDGVQGLLEDRYTDLTWMSVRGWTGLGGAELGTLPQALSSPQAVQRARQVLQSGGIHGLLIVGDTRAYQVASALARSEGTGVPVVVVPAAIENDLPFTDLCIGTDTALNNAMWAVDRIKDSAVAVRHVFLVEVMGEECGYLAVTVGLATGAEQVYIPEEPLTLEVVQADVAHLLRRFREHRPLGLIIRNEQAGGAYTTPVLASIFQAEGEEVYQVRYAILGHLQQGGSPTPFDRILATRMGAHGMHHLLALVQQEEEGAYALGREQGRVHLYPIPPSLPAEERWWLCLLPLVRLMSGRDGRVQSGT
ncbi:MAG: 6-phosphofructokinase [Chloroflexi bacterium]|nr:6-phosphofructokinase [Chloroflexota bacterium]